MSDTRPFLHEALDRIRADVVLMAGLVEEGIANATSILLEGGDPAPMYARDDRIDELEQAIDERVCSVIATQTPVAGDLRALLAAVRVITDIERTGDLMLTVVKSAGYMNAQLLPAEVRGLVQRMGDEAQLLYRSAVDAWVDLDLRLAASLPALDAGLDALTADLYARLLSREPDVERGAVVGLALVARCYERAGDHAVNIGRRVVFTLTGIRPPEHAPSRGQSA